MDSLVGLCKLECEYAGYLIYHENVVEYPFLSGSGTGSSVHPTKKIIVQPPMYAIEFHTHPSLLGSMWKDRFSSGDHATFRNRIDQEGEGYAHVLITSENILTWGKGKAMNVRIGFGASEIVVANFNKWNKKYGCWADLEL